MPTSEVGQGGSEAGGGARGVGPVGHRKVEVAVGLATPRLGRRALQPDCQGGDRVLAVPQEGAVSNEFHVQRRHVIPVGWNGAQGSLRSRPLQEPNWPAVLCI